MKKLLLFLSILLIFGCSTEVDSVKQDAVIEAAAKGKPTKAQKTILLKPTVVNNNEVGNIMLNPVEYTGTLPAETNIVDWDGDGQVDDIVEYSWRCYFPRTFGEVRVLLNGTDEVLVNITVGYGLNIYGFDDVNNDGTQDIIFWRYSRDADYNLITVYSVGYNVQGQYPLPLADIIGSLEVFESDRNPERVLWDLSDYGIDYMVFHVYVHSLQTGIYVQSHRDGAEGMPLRDKNVRSGDIFQLQFSNVEICEERIIVEFIIP